MTTMAIVSCQKDDGVEPIKKMDASEVVKNYFGLNYGAKKMSSGNGTKAAKELENKLKREHVSLIPQGGDECQEYESLDNGYILTFLPCSMLEGGFSELYYSETDKRVFSYNVCSLNPSYSEICKTFYQENGKLTGDMRYYKMTNIEPMPDGTYFEYLLDYIYKKKSITLTLYNKIDNVYNEQELTFEAPVMINERSSGIKYKGNTYNSLCIQDIEISYDTEVEFDTNEYVDENGVTHTQEIERSVPIEYNIKGVEEVEYQHDGQQGVFTINYGDGEFDSKAIITENGMSYEVDYVELEKARWEEINSARY